MQTFVSGTGEECRQTWTSHQSAPFSGGTSDGGDMEPSAVHAAPLSPEPDDAPSKQHKLKLAGQWVQTSAKPY